MEFLKEILGEDLFNQVKNKVSSYNEKVDKDKKISIANVNGGEFIAKAKYDQLKTDLDNIKTSLDTANTTIADLKKNNGDNADLQQKVSDYETKIADLEATGKAEKAKMLKDALYAEKAKHPELLISKFDLSKIVLDEKGENVVSGIEEQMKSNKETYKDLFGETEQQGGAYHYTPNGGENKGNSGATDFVGIIKENQVRKI